MAQRYRSDALAAIHDTIEDLHDIGLVDKVTMKEFDDACLVPIEEISPEEIRNLRDSESLSQPVFARYLNVSKNLVSDWERGIKKPGGPALRLLSIIKKNGLTVFLDSDEASRAIKACHRRNKKQLTKV